MTSIPDKGVQIWRLVKINDGQWQQVDTLVTKVLVNKMETTRQTETAMYAIPSDYHIAIPLGSNARTYNVGFIWDEYNQCGGTAFTFGTTLKQWDCSTLYYINLRQSSMFADVGPDDQYVICKQLQIERSAPGLSRGVDSLTQPGYNRPLGRWKVSMSCVTAPTPSMEVCPAFTIPYMWPTPHMRTDKIGLYLENVADPTQYIDARLTHIVVTYQTDAETFAVPGQMPIAILPLLGSTGPVIDIEFNVKNDEDFARIQSWVTGRGGDTVVRAASTSYDEIDDDDPTGVYTSPVNGVYKHSKWIVSSMQVSRTHASGGAFDPVTATGTDTQGNWRHVQMTLTRYWKWELMANAY